jgi:integrator complex subunit 2
VCDVLAIAMAELPNLLPPTEVAEALLRIKFGPEIICHIVANLPDSFKDGKFIGRAPSIMFRKHLF